MVSQSILFYFHLLFVFSVVCLAQGRRSVRPATGGSCVYSRKHVQLPDHVETRCQEQRWFVAFHHCTQRRDDSQLGLSPFGRWSFSLRHLPQTRSANDPQMRLRRQRSHISAVGAGTGGIPTRSVCSIQAWESNRKTQTQTDKEDHQKMIEALSMIPTAVALVLDAGLPYDFPI